MTKVRLKDIAKKAGVSVGTVSLILNQKAEQIRISAKLIKKVTDVANALGYVPNQIAVSLRTGQTKVICLVVEDFANPFFAEITSLVEARLREKGYQLVCSSIANDPLNTTKLIKKLSNGLVDGFFITPMPGLKNDIQMLVKAGMPVVLLDSYYPDLNISHVLTDNNEGVVLGIRHLIENGYKNILFVSVDYGMIQIHHREESYKKVMKENGLKPDILRLKYGEVKSANKVQLCKKIHKRKPDALFFATNYLGIEGLECINSLSLKIPDDIGVVCFDDHDVFRLYKPAITVVEQSINTIVDCSMEIMFSRLSNKPTKETAYQLIPPRLIVRNSSNKNF